MSKRRLLQQTKQKLKSQRSTRGARQQQNQASSSVRSIWSRTMLCVKSRGLGTQRRRKKRRQALGDSEGPRIFSDFFFMSTEEDSVPMLALKFSRAKRVAATALPQKSVSDLGGKFFANFIKMTGVKRFINFSDGEPTKGSSSAES